MSKIDYEITVDVRNLSVEERTRVQQAYFNLGIGWSSRYAEATAISEYASVIVKAFTNLNIEGKAESNIYYYSEWDESIKPTHTPEQLFELAGINDIPECMEPFDLECALSGDPVVTRDGVEVGQVSLFNDVATPNCIRAVVGGEIYAYDIKGNHAGGDELSKLFMFKKTHKVNGFEVPMPLKIAPEKGDRFWVEILSSEGFCAEIVWCGGSFSKMVMERGIAHSTEESAIANAKARLGIDPYS